VTVPFSPVLPGSANPGAAAPATPRNLQQRGGEPNPSAAAIASRFPALFVRSEVIWGDTNVYIKPHAVSEVVRWLHDDPAQQYDYLSDVTAVEFRDPEQPLEVVWHLRSLPYRRFLRLKASLDKRAPLEVDSVWPIYKGADWLERECYDMFGITFKGHPDLRRILMWESYREGYPLRKDFPLRGRFSRAEQLRQALSITTEGRYSMEELSVAQAFEDLPEDMRRHLADGERTGE